MTIDFAYLALELALAASWFFICALALWMLSGGVRQRRRRQIL